MSCPVEKKAFPGKEETHLAFRRALPLRHGLGSMIDTPHGEAQVVARTPAGSGHTGQGGGSSGRNSSVGNQSGLSHARNQLATPW